MPISKMKLDNSRRISRQLSITMLLNRYLPVVGGAEMQAYHLSQELKKRGHEVNIVTRRLTQDLTLHEEIDGIPVRRLHPVGLSHRANALIIPRLVWHLLRRARSTDVIHVHNVGPLGVAAIIAGKIMRKPVILKVPLLGGLVRKDEEGITTSGYSRFIRRYVLPPVLWRSIIQQADAIVALSEELRDEGRKAGFSAQMVTIPNGVDTGKYAPAGAAQRAALRHQSSIPTEKRVLLFSGRLVQRKRVDVLLSALPQIIELNPDVLLLLAGSGKMQADDVEDHLRQIVNDLGLHEHVRFLGMIDNVADLLRTADVYVFPSEREGMPNAVLEAMATGLPIVASAIGGVTDLLDESTGWLVPAGDVDAMRDALLNLLANPQAAHLRGAAARARAEERFSIEVVADAYIDLYRRLID